MSIRHILVILSCLVSGVAAFALARVVKNQSGQRGAGVAGEPAGAAEPEVRVAKVEVPTAENSALIAEWEKVRSGYGEGIDAFPAVFATIKDIKDAFRRRSFRAALIAEWVARDAPGALKFFRDAKDSTNAAQTMREWMRIDTNGAVSGLIASGSGWQSLGRDLLTDIARAVPHRVAEVAAQLPKPTDRWDMKVRDAFEIVAAGGIDGARQSAEALSGWAREQALQGVAKAFGEKDGAAAMTWARSLPEKERDDALRAALTGWAKTEPMLALSHVKEVPPGGDQMMYASDVGAKVLQEAAKVDFDGTLRWLKENPGKIGHESLTGLTSEVSRRLAADPIGTLETLRGSDDRAMNMVLSNSLLNEGYTRKDEVWKWLQTQPSDSFTDDLRMTLIRAAAWKEPEAAIALMEQLPDNEKSRQILRDCAGSLINNGGNSGRLEDLLAKVSPRLRPHLIQAGLTHGRGDWHTEEAEKWIARIDDIPTQNRGQAIGNVGSRWAATDPDAAVKWATALPDAGERSLAIASIAGGWARTDSYEASQWIATLPAGQERDAAAVSLVTAIAQAEPDSAWEWAQSIKTEQARMQALSVALRGWHQKDPSTAQQILESAPLAPAEKESLSRQLQSFSRAGGNVAIPMLIR